MGFWQSLIGTKAHCAGCGQVVDPHMAIRDGQDLYCSEVCKSQVVRLSHPPTSGAGVPSSSGVPTTPQQPRGKGGQNPTR